MTSFPILDLVIGLIFIFFLLSIISSSGVELWFSFMKTRAKLMEEWLVKIFDKEALNSDGTPSGVSLGRAIMDHCMVTGLSESKKSPSYISSSSFVTALLDKITLAPAPTGLPQAPPSDLEGYITAITASDSISGELKRTILSFAVQALQARTLLATVPGAVKVADDVKSDLDDFRQRIEKWYDINSERLTGAFKRRKAMPATLIVAIILTIGLNADTVSISSYLYNHPDQTKEFADKATATYKNMKVKMDTLEAHSANLDDQGFASADEMQKGVDSFRNDLNKFTATLPAGMPIGWQNENYDFKNNLGRSIREIIIKHGLGWLATILAISMGAPFWFDLLNKISNLRSTGPKPVSTATAANTSNT